MSHAKSPAQFKWWSAVPRLGTFSISEQKQKVKPSKLLLVFISIASLFSKFFKVFSIWFECKFAFSHFYSLFIVGFTAKHMRIPSTKRKGTIISYFQKNQQSFSAFINKFKDDYNRYPSVNRSRLLGLFFFEQIQNILLKANPESQQFNYQTHFCNGLYGSGKTKFACILADHAYLNDPTTMQKVLPHVIHNAPPDYNPQCNFDFHGALEKQFQILQNDKSQSCLNFLFQNENEILPSPESDPSIDLKIQRLTRIFNLLMSLFFFLSSFCFQLIKSPLLSPIFFLSQSKIEFMRTSQKYSIDLAKNINGIEDKLKELERILEKEPVASRPVNSVIIWHIDGFFFHFPFVSFNMNYHFSHISNNFEKPTKKIMKKLQILRDC